MVYRIMVGHLYEATSEREMHVQQSDTIRMPEFVAEVQKIIDNEPSNSMCTTAREKGVDEKLIRLVVHGDIYNISHKMRDFCQRRCKKGD